MKYAVIYSSRTGNTKLLAETIIESMGEKECLYFGPAKEDRDVREALEASDMIFAGFWTDKGSCDIVMAEILKTMENSRVFLFGTAGFGGAPAYFEQILERVKGKLPDSARIAGTYMCQGKMPAAVRERYVKMKNDGVPGVNADAMIENFDRALSHPDEKDLEELKQRMDDIKEG